MYSADRFIDVLDSNVRKVVDALQDVLMEEGVKLVPEIRLLIEKHVLNAYRMALMKRDYSLDLLINLIAVPVIRRLYPGKQGKNVLYRVRLKLENIGVYRHRLGPIRIKLSW